MKNVFNAKVKDLHVHESYEKIYEVSNRQRELLKDSILETNGVLEPIVITENNEIVHGVQRFEVYKELGWEEIPATILDNASSVDVGFYMISYNRHKDKSMLERWNEINYLKTIYQKKQGERTDLQDGLSDFDRLTTRQKIALHCGISEGNVYKITKIAEENIQLLNMISTGELSIHQAYETATGKIKKKSASEDSGSPMEEVHLHTCPNCNHQF